MPDNQYELTSPFDATAGEPVLLVARAQEPKQILQAFSSIRFIETFTVKTGKDKERSIHLFELEGYFDQPAQ